MENAEIINPFGYLVASKVIDENRKPVDFWTEYLATNQIVEENEFYLLFSDGLLVKKGRSKFKSSQYTFGDEYKSFQKYYDDKKNNKNDPNSDWAWIAHGITN
jgi:hypothetical protein